MSGQQRLLASAAVLLLLALALAGWRAGQAPWRQWLRRYNAVHPEQTVPLAPRPLTPTLTGRTELCTTCHLGIEEISSSHPLDAFGCVICHGGDGLALDADRAHATLRGGRNPSDLSVVAESCGQANCHSGHDAAHADQNQVERVLRSLQATYAGGIALVRFTFGAQPDRRARYAVRAVADPNPPPDQPAALATLPFSAAEDIPPALVGQSFDVSQHPIDTRFRQGCLDGGCHLWEPATPAPYRMRSTGCAACHYLYADDGLYAGGDLTIARDEPGHGREHRLTTAIPFSQCNHCHNRGVYSLRAMEFHDRPDLPPAGPPLSEFLSRQGRRLAEYYQPVGPFTLCEWELDCIDCHTSDEAMGNGHIAGKIEDSRVIECRTCHGTVWELPQTAPIVEEDERALRQARLNGRGALAVGDRVVVTARGEKLWAVREVEPGRFVQTLKVSGETLEVPLAYGTACPQKPDEQESRYCHACHAYDREREAAVAP